MSGNDGQASGFQIYSLGIVVEDKEDGDYIKVMPVEKLPQAFGKVSDIAYDYQVQGKDHKGVDTASSAKGVAYVVATWRSLSEGNRQTAPDVYEGETVLLFKYGSANDVFWCTLGREAALRRQEDVIWAFSNLKEKNLQPYTLESCYWFQVNTKGKRVRLHTSNNDGEPVSFDLDIDTAEGTLVIKDSNSNEMHWDAVAGTFKLTMMESIELATKKIYFNGEELIHSKAPDITEEGDDIKNKAGNSHQTSAGSSWSVKSDGSAKIEAASPVQIDPAIEAAN